MLFKTLCCAIWLAVESVECSRSRDESSRGRGGGNSHGHGNGHQHDHSDDSRRDSSDSSEDFTSTIEPILTTQDSEMEYTYTFGINGGQISISEYISLDFDDTTFIFNDTQVNIIISNQYSENIADLFNETTVMHRAFGLLTYNIGIQFVNTWPHSDNISASITIPNDLIEFNDNLLNSNNSIEYGYEVFTTCKQGSLNESEYLIFVLLPSILTVDSQGNNILNVNIPSGCFTNISIIDNNTPNTFEIMLTVSLTPGANNNERRLLQSGCDTSNDNECKASSIQCPLANGCVVTSPYGVRKHPISGEITPHRGVDYKAANGDIVQAAASGVIEKSYLSTSFGNTIILRHNDGSATLYAHLKSRSVKHGDSVTAGQSIGLSDNTGISTGPHLHFEYVPNGEILQNKNRIDPDACVGALLQGSITVSDSGSLADDAFEILIDGLSIGQTNVGATNTLAINNLNHGNHVLTLNIIYAPDDIGTYTVTLQNGWTFSDGTSSKTGSEPQGTFLQWTFNVPLC